jgi:hypothetical protein
VAQLGEFLMAWVFSLGAWGTHGVNEAAFIVKNLTIKNLKHEESAPPGYAGLRVRSGRFAAAAHPSYPLRVASLPVGGCCPLSADYVAFGSSVLSPPER